MCAISGIRLKTDRISIAKATAWCAAMTARMIHRGPDDQGSYVDPKRGVVLGHRRLSIIDLSPAGRQPIFNEDRSLAVMVNGEIYNHRDLRTELKGRGHHFRSDCDVEVVAHLFEEKADGGWDDLRGMYAAAVYAEKTGVLYLARDPLGIKPCKMTLDYMMRFVLEHSPYSFFILCVKMIRTLQSFFHFYSQFCLNFTHQLTTIKNIPAQNLGKVFRKSCGSRSYAAGNSNIANT